MYGNEEISIKYLLALLNSKLIGYYVKKTGDKSKQELFPRISMRTLKSLPVKLISEEVQAPFIEKVEKIINTKKENPKADTSQIEAEINQMVYKLYELTDEEIAIVESKK